jgi:hypothetical protein
MNRRIPTTLVIALVVSIFTLTSITTPVLAVRPNEETFSATFGPGDLDPPVVKYEWWDKNGDLHQRVSVGGKSTITGATPIEMKDGTIITMDEGTFEGTSNTDMSLSGVTQIWGRGQITLDGQDDPSYQVEFRITLQYNVVVASSMRIIGRGIYIEGTMTLAGGLGFILDGYYWTN